MAFVWMVCVSVILVGKARSATRQHRVGSWVALELRLVIAVWALLTLRAPVVHLELWIAMVLVVPREN